MNRDKLNVEGDKIDLSLSNLISVPIKSIQSVPKAIRLDLSCNLISNLSNDFGSLVQLVEIDLSKNQLQDLPSTFGNLIRLQHLDLSENHISDLPLSFSQLSNLKYLDLKGNPLNDKLRPVAGFCLDESECRSCARKVVAHYKNIKATADKHRQREEQLKQDALQKAAEKEKKEQDAMRLYRKLEREKKRLEEEQKRLQANWDTDQLGDTSVVNEFKDKRDQMPQHKPFKFSPKTLALCIFAAIFIGAMFYALWIVGVGPSAFMKSDL